MAGIDQQDGQKEWLIPDEVYAGLSGQFSRNDSAMYDLRDVFVKRAFEVCGDNNDLLLELYVRLLNEVLDELIGFVDSDLMQRLVACNSVEEVLQVKLPNGFADSFKSVINRLGYLGFDYSGNREHVCSQIKNPPFNVMKGGDVLFEVAENFQHAIYEMLNGQILYGVLLSVSRVQRYAELIDDVEKGLRDLKKFSHLPAVANVFRGYKNIVNGVVENGRVNLAALLADVRAMLAYRFGQEMADLVLIDVDPNMEISGADFGKLLVAVLEICKNPCRKPTREELADYHERGKSFLQIKAARVQHNGGIFDVIQVVDDGKFIDVNKVIEAAMENGCLPNGVWMARDFDLGEILDSLSARRLSIPVEDGGKMSSGIGLHSAKRILGEHSGNMFFTNMYGNGRGVMCAIVLPVLRSSDDELYLSGVDLDAIMSQVEVACSGSAVVLCSDDFARGESELRETALKRGIFGDTAKKVGRVVA